MHFHFNHLEVKSLSHVQFFATPWTVAHQAPPSMGFSRQEYWSGLPFPFPGDLPDPGIEPRSPAFQADTLTSKLPGKPFKHLGKCKCVSCWTWPLLTDKNWWWSLKWWHFSSGILYIHTEVISGPLELLLLWVQHKEGKLLYDLVKWDGWLCKKLL